jgi:hypothetical protein
LHKARGTPGGPHYGCAVYLELLNPLSYASSGPCRVLTASLPAALSRHDLAGLPARGAAE